MGKPGAGAEVDARHEPETPTVKLIVYDPGVMSPTRGVKVDPVPLVVLVPIFQSQLVMFCGELDVKVIDVPWQNDEFALLILAEGVIGV